MAPLALVVVGGLMLFRSALLDVKPFPPGSSSRTIGLMVTLGGEHGGAVGNVLGGGVARLLGGTGSAPQARPGLLARRAVAPGGLLRGAPRRSHRVVRRAVARPEKATGRQQVSAPPPLLAHHEPPVDVVHDYPDVVSEGLSEPPPLLLQADAETEGRTAVFGAPRAEGEYVPRPGRR